MSNKTTGVRASMTTVQTPGMGFQEYKAAGFSHGASHRTVMVSVPSNAKEVRIAIKPNLIAQEDRQERMNKTVAFGYVPISRKTDR